MVRGSPKIVCIGSGSRNGAISDALLQTNRFQPSEPSCRLTSSIAREIHPGFDLVAVHRARQEHAAQARRVQFAQQRLGDSLGAFDLVRGGGDRAGQIARPRNRVRPGEDIHALFRPMTQRLLAGEMAMSTRVPGDRRRPCGPERDRSLLGRTAWMSVPCLARWFQPARIRMAGLAMLRPRASDMIKLAVPGSLVARWMGWDRRAQKIAALKRTTMARATLHARLRVRLALA